MFDTALSRRALLRSAGGLVLAFGITPAGAAVGTADEVASLGAFVRIGTDESVTIVSPGAELGQGIFTAVAMIVADELRADWSRISVEASPATSAYWQPGTQRQSTSGSRTIRTYHDALRLAGATAREMLIEAAALDWNVDPGECRARNGRISHAPSGREATFGALATRAAALEPPRTVRLTEVADREFTGRPVKRLDTSSKVHGTAIFGIDVRRPGILFAAIRQAPVFGSRLTSVDPAPALACDGVVRVIPLVQAVVVVASSFWRARTALDRLSPVFSTSDTAAPSDPVFRAVLANRVDGEDSKPVAAAGDARAVLAGSGSIIEAKYGLPFLCHAAIEPMNCTAEFAEDGCHVWVPHQSQTMVLKAVKQITGFNEDRIHIHVTLSGGAFGRRFETDFVEQALLVAREVGRPVQLIWTREEDLQHDFYRPAVAGRLQAVLDSSGGVAALEMRIASPAVIEHTLGKMPESGIDVVAIQGIGTETDSKVSVLGQYRILNVAVGYAHQPSQVPVGYWRSIGASHNIFFIESFVDEMAAAAAIDPYTFRQRLLAASPRGLAVLDRAADAVGWTTAMPPGQGRGMAFCDFIGSLACTVAEVTVQGDKLRVDRLVCVVDCGIVINPNSARAQIEGGALFGLSSALSEEALFRGGRCLTQNFADYRVLRIQDATAIDVHLAPNGGKPGGLGEIGVPGVAPALCNAIFAANGRRIRHLPVLPALTGS